MEIVTVQDWDYRVKKFIKKCQVFLYDTTVHCDGYRVEFEKSFDKTNAGFYTVVYRTNDKLYMTKRYFEPNRTDISTWLFVSKYSTENIKGAGIREEKERIKDYLKFLG